MSNSALHIRFTKEEFAHLIELSDESQMSPVSYIRLMIEYAYQGNRLSKQLDKIQKGELNEIELNGYGYGIHKEEFDAFIDTMENAIKGLNLTEKGVKKRVTLKRKSRLKVA
jgi:hypothetical protein